MTVVGLTGRQVVCGAGLFFSICLGACRFERHVPEGSSKDEATLQAITTGFYRALAQRDSTQLDAITFGSATILLAAGASAPVLIARRSLSDIPERRTLSPGIRLVRTELHPDADFALIRAELAAQDGVKGAEYEATDWLTLARRGGEWRIAHVMFGPWRLRSAP